MRPSVGTGPLGRGRVARDAPINSPRVSLRLYDTATAGALRDFEPRSNRARVGMYICGLTTQAAPHIGHIRFAVAFDVLRRWLEAGHGYDVTVVRNVTDIDDKMLRKSRRGTVSRGARCTYRNERLTGAGARRARRHPGDLRAAGHRARARDGRADGDPRRQGARVPARDGSGDVYFDVRSLAATTAR